MANKLLSILGKHGELTTRQIADIANRHARSVHAELGQLLRKELVVCVGDAPRLGLAGRPNKVWRLSW